MKTRYHIFLTPVISLGLLAFIPACQSNKESAQADEPVTETTMQSVDTVYVSTDSALPEKVGFNEHIRPIFSDTCFACHGFDKNTREADLRLDTPEGAYAELKDTKIGERAIVPGKPEESKVWKVISTDNQEELMPPVKFHKPLSPYQKNLIKKWIEQGAEYQNHWAYMPIEKPAVPTLSLHSDKVENPIDHFILNKLEKEQISPTELADKSTILRRLTLDLTGLPPTPKELKAFLDDDSPEAYEKQVDRLLASPHYGERMSVMWLDVARYADTVGFHGDQNQNIFPYRDYVINAFNNDKPFDQFTIEQLAGDLLENPTDEQLVATGFTRLSLMTREGGAQPKEYLAKYTSDRVRSVGAAFLGLTTGCAECHDHKFDPITAKDFYAMGAFFNDIKQWGVYADYRTYSPVPDISGYGNDHSFPPELVTLSQSMLSRLAALRTQAHEENAHLAKGKVTPAWEKEVIEYLAANPTGWAPAIPQEVVSAKNTPHEVLSDGSVLLTGKEQKDDKITLKLKLQPGHLTSFRIEVLPHTKNNGRIGRAKDGKFSMGTPTFQLVQPDGKPGAGLLIAWAQADLQAPSGYRSGSPIVQLAKTWTVGSGAQGLPKNPSDRPHTAIHILKNPIDVPSNGMLKVTLPSSNLGRVRISTTRFAEPIAGQPATTSALANALSTAAADRSPQQKTLIDGTWALAHLDSKALTPNWATLQSEIRKCRSGIAFTLVADRFPEDRIPVTRILPRGDWQNETGEIVQPAVLHFLPQPEKKEKLTRLDLAKWLVSDENPLTARHVMNRTWKQFFGTGLSNVLDDLGSQGEWPSHPLLLDWLADTFRSNGWKTKPMIKLMVMSHTYRQKAAVRNDLKDFDPYNRLLAQQSARRLDAEFIRDNGLAISGLLSADYIGGPSVFPYQPPGYYAAIQFPDRKYITSSDKQRYRRGVYMHWQRTFLHPMLANFDAPSREECSADRLQSNTPLQALTQLNDKNSVEMARALALKLISDAPEETAASRITLGFHRALSRDPSAKELESLTAFLDKQIKHYQEKPEDTKKLIAPISGADAASRIPEPELAAWIQLSRALLNLHETITRY